MLPNVSLSSAIADSVIFDTVDECVLYAMSKEKQEFSFDAENCTIAGKYVYEDGAVTYVKKCE